jgi:hypothetical protein
MQIATLSFDEFSACLLALSFRVETLWCTYKRAKSKASYPYLLG